MKAKLFLGVFIALVVSTSMQALDILFINNSPMEVNGEIWVFQAGRNEERTRRRDLKAIRGVVNWHLDPGEALSRLTFMYKKGYKWIIWGDELMANNIPVSALSPNKVRVHIENTTGKIGIVVDNGRKIVMQAHPEDLHEEV